MPRNNSEPLPRSSILSLKCALAPLPLGHPGLPSRCARVCAGGLDRCAPCGDPGPRLRGAFGRTACAISFL